MAELPPSGRGEEQGSAYITAGYVLACALQAVCGYPQEKTINTN